MQARKRSATKRGDTLIVPVNTPVGSEWELVAVVTVPVRGRRTPRRRPPRVVTAIVEALAKRD